MIFGLTLWKLWQLRNDSLFSKGSFMKPTKNGIYSLTRTYHKVTVSIEKMVPNSKPKIVDHSTWTRPDDGSFKLNLDAAIHFNRKVAAMGSLLRDHHGNCVGAFTFNIGFCSPLFSEILAIYHGLKWMTSLSLDKIIIGIDSSLAVKTISNP